MHTAFRTACWAGAICVALSFLCASSRAQFQVEQQLPVRHDVGPALRDMPVIPPETVLRPQVPLGVRVWPGGALDLGGTSVDPALQVGVGPLVNTTPGLAFDGLGTGFPQFTDTTAPPDNNGAIGAYQYVEWVNFSFVVFSKATGAVLYGPAAGNTVWRGFGGLCESHNDGDPIVLYDHLANRWVMTQFALDATNRIYMQCIAVSQSEDITTGNWNRYAYAMPNFNSVPGCNDYPKLGVWPDAYYMTFNMFTPTCSGSFIGVRVAAFDRNAMVAGSPTAAWQFVDLTNTSYFSLLPSDLDGARQPVAGTPNYLIDFRTNVVDLWRYYVDFIHPNNAHLDGPFNVGNVDTFTPGCNGFVRGRCVPQNGTSRLLEALGDRVMYRLAYRNLVDNESLVVNHTVEVNAQTHGTGIRWYEIRNPGGAPTAYQHATWMPDASFRWMGSIAMDHLGNMALGYSVSSPTLYPAIRYTGRLVTDTQNTLQAETSILEGNGSQPLINRWGDYTSMSIDPVFDCTFWYVNEYFQTTDSVHAYNWSTHIASFNFPSCLACVGDCGRDGQVTIDEIIRMVNIRLGSQPIVNCLRGDGDGDGRIECYDTNQAVNNDFNGCPANSGLSPTSTSTTPAGPYTIASFTISQTIGSASGSRGSSVTIPVSVTGGGGALSATDLDLIYPTAILTNPNCAKDTRLTAHSLSWALSNTPPPPSGNTRLSTMIADLSSASTFADGRTFTCTFTISSTAPSGTYSITGQYQDGSDHPGNKVISTVTNGSVTVL